MLAAQETVYEVDELNAGLAQPVLALDQATPQTAIASFLDAVEADDFARAAHVLNLNDLAVAAQAERGPQLAEQLGAIIDRKVVLNWQALLERPDSLDSNLPGDDPMAGQARRSLMIAVLESDTRPVAIRLNRVKPADRDAVWVFSRQAVGNIEQLYDLYGPSQIEQSLPAWLRAKGPMGLYWWEIIGIPLMLCAAAIAALITWRLMTLAGRRTRDSVLGKLVHDLRIPVTLFALGTTMSLATGYVFVVSGLVSNILEPVLVLIFVSAAMIVAVNIIDAVLERVMVKDVEDLASPEAEDRRAYATTIFAVRRLTVAIAVLLCFGITLTTANVFKTLGFSLLAGAGGLTLMLGFAAREVLANILASLQISANRSARVGDHLVFEGELCTVERIHFSFVQLKVWNSTRLIVPVSEFVSKSFINRTLIESDMIRTVVLTVSPQTDVGALRAFYEDWMDNDDRVGGPSTYECLVTGQDGFGLKVRMCAQVPDPRDGWAVECALREAAVEYLCEQTGQRLPHIGITSNEAHRGKFRSGRVGALCPIEAAIYFFCIL